MSRFRYALLFCAALAVVGFSWAAFANLIQNRHTAQTVFDNGGAAWPFFSKVAAINYDNGGQGAGYNVPAPDPTDCPAGATYRPDAVNLKTSTAGAPAIPFQIGCVISPNSYNYTINISLAGPYQITLQLADNSAGGSWNILIDGAVVANVATPNTGSFDTFSASTSGPFSASLGIHKLTIAWATGDTNFATAGDFLSWQGAVAAATTINSVTISCGGSCAFVGGTAGTVGTAQAAMSNGSFAGSWSLRTSGTDNFQATCNNYGSNFTITTQPDHTGVVSNGAIANGTYDGVCLLATQAGAGGSPFAKAVSITGFPAGSTPAPALAAGYTTEALNADFSQSFYANLANWVQDCGGPTSGLRFGFRWSDGGSAPCSRISTFNDPAIGNKQVLHLQFLTSDDNGSHGSSFQYMALDWPAFFSDPEFINLTNGLPVDLYTEIVFKLSPASLSQKTSLDVFNYFHSDCCVNGNNPPGGGNIEPDNLEVQSNTSPTVWGDGFIEYCNGSICGGCQSAICNPGGLPTVSDLTVYHKFGTLWTSDGTSQYWKCEWLDDQKLGCGGDTGFNHPNVLTIHNLTTTFWFGTSQTGQLNNNVDVFIQSLTVWSCPSWQTSLCAGTVITQ